MSEQIEEDLVETLKNSKKTYEDIQNSFDKSRTTIRKMLKSISQEYNLQEETVGKNNKKIFYIPQYADRVDDIHTMPKKSHYCIGATGDWHVGAEATNYDEIKRYMEDIDKKEADAILHSGDLLDGFGVFRGQVQELLVDDIDGKLYNCTSLDEQKDLFEEYIQLPTDLKVISGNHEYKSKRKGGHNPLQEMAKYIKNMDYLGEFNETVDFNGVKFELIHPRGGRPYSKSYRSQTLLRERNPENLPDIFGVGHTHDSGYFLTQGVHTFLTGTFLGLNNLSKRYGMDTISNAYILEFDVNDGDVKNLIIEHKRYD